MKPAAPEHIGLMLTDRCPLRCGHCLYACSPQRGEDASPERVAATLDDLERLGWREVPVHLGGGEPFLVFETLFVATGEVVQRGFHLEFVETSGSWYNRREQAVPWLHLLRLAGLRRLLVSATAFHLNQSFGDRWRELVEVARGIFGDKAVEVERSSQLTLGGRAPYAMRTTLPATPAAELDCNAQARLLGRRKWHIGPDGRVHSGYCAGIAFPADTGVGNWYLNFDLEDWPVAKALVHGGLTSLLAMAEREAGFQPNPCGYVSECHLCQEARLALWQLRRYPELGPDGFYRELEVCR